MKARKITKYATGRNKQEQVGTSTSKQECIDGNTREQEQAKPLAMTDKQEGAGTNGQEPAGKMQESEEKLEHEFPGYFSCRGC